MRVLFIYPDVGTLLPPDFQHGVGTLMAVLKKAGHEPRLQITVIITPGYAQHRFYAKYDEGQEGKDNGYHGGDLSRPGTAKPVE